MKWWPCFADITRRPRRVNSPMRATVRVVLPDFLFPITDTVGGGRSERRFTLRKRRSAMPPNSSRGICSTSGAAPSTKRPASRTPAARASRSGSSWVTG